METDLALLVCLACANQKQKQKQKTAIKGVAPSHLPRYKQRLRKLSEEKQTLVDEEDKLRQWGKGKHRQTL
jgi:hypothetical protein